MAGSFRIGIAQITSTDKISANLELVEKIYSQAVSARAELVVFPENSLFFRIRAGEPLLGLKWMGDEVNRLQKMVDRHKTPLMLTTALQSGGTKLSNSTMLLQAEKQPELLYSKIHLFDVDVPGAPPVRESENFESGSEPRVVEIGGWKFGLSICYDLRFSELYARYAQKVDVILIPSAFLVPTGQAHWQVLLRARAIENQCFVAAPAQSGEHRSGDQVRQTYGHSLVVDPWGQIVAELTASPEMQVVELKRELIDQVRAQIPMRDHRRL